jgi:zinc D-Ala-D-Ala carboxypeptidase
MKDSSGFIVPTYFTKEVDLKIDWDRVDPVALDQLNLARHVAGVPFRITSHYRTPEKSLAVGGSPTDAHTQVPCGAFDIAYTNTLESYRIVRGLIFAGFPRVGINARNRHIHADVSTSLPSPRFWVE